MADISAEGTGLRVVLPVEEARILRMLCEEMRTLLEADLPRADPVTSRIFPDAYEDPEEARQYQDLVHDELRSAKLEALAAMTSDLKRRGGMDARLEPGRAESWITVLADMRLAIGTRLEVTEDSMNEELDPDDPEASAMAVLHWLGYVQGMMVEGLDGGRPRPEEDHGGGEAI